MEKAPEEKSATQITEDEKTDEDLGIRQATFADIDIKSQLGIQEGDVLVGEIVERYPNGNYKVRATKKIPFKGSSRFISLVGIARAADIADDDTVSAGKLYEYRIKAFR